MGGGGVSKTVSTLRKKNDTQLFTLLFSLRNQYQMNGSIIWKIIHALLHLLMINIGFYSKTQSMSDASTLKARICKTI